MNIPKVFGIGFQKTGTTSLKHALRRLGYRVGRNVRVRHPQSAEDLPRLALRQLDHYDGFQDNPWPFLYEELDQRCPGSKFILTIRSTEQWIRSVGRHFGGTTAPIREWIYGVGDPLGHEEIWIRRYEAHNAAVLEYFRDRPKDLLVFRTGEGDGWPELCRFLGREPPPGPFPCANRAEDRQGRKSLIGRVRRGARRRLRALGSELTRRLT